MSEAKLEITIVGLGLLGSSLAASLRQSSQFSITGVSSPSTLQKAFELDLIDRGFQYSQVELWAQQSDIVFLCTPIQHIIATLNQIGIALKNNTKPLIITDVGSTKKEICNHAQNCLPASVIFVGGHPMAGSQKSGIEAYDETLFENAYWILCPSPLQANEDYASLTAIIKKVGATLVTLDPDKHDAVMAELSHTPQLIASAMASGLSEKDLLAGNFQHLAGPGFRDMTRIAASSWSMWKDIFTSNTSEIQASLRRFESRIGQIRQSLNTAPNLSELESVFEQGAQVRSRLSGPGKGFTIGLCEILVKVKDEPGMISQIITPLAATGTDIRDIELLKVREGIGGTLLLAFASLEIANQAVQVLADNGFQARLR
jgi:prephenate dehydrogenase